MGEKVAEGSGAGAQLIPGLPEELVLSQVLSRLPWYSRPVCRAISKLWKAKVDTKNPDREIKTRSIQLPLLRNLFLICTFDKQIFIRDNEIRGPWRSDAYRIQPLWRRLPPLQGLIEPAPIRTVMVASSGMVYVWSDGGDFVLKLDIGCGDWSWNKFPVPYDFTSDAVCFNGHIYMPGISMRSPTGSQSSAWRKGVLVYDMMADKCGQVETWNHDNLTVVSPQSSYVEEMYSFVEHESDSELELKMYDVGSDSWKTWEKLPFPEYQWSVITDFKVLNGDCFEPVAETGTNVVWIDNEGEVITWFNSSLGKLWVGFDFNAICDGKYMEYMQIIRGSLYAFFLQEPDEQEEHEDEEDEEGLCRRFIMKGKIMVESDRVAWDEVHEVGFFQEAYTVDTARIGPIGSYTVMA